MEVMESIKGRRSIRGFRLDPIESHKIRTLKEALIWAPSAGNLQSRHFYFVFNRAMKGRLAATTRGQDFIAEAPLVVVGCADLRIGASYGERGVELYCIQDVSCSIQNMMLAAHSMDLGSVWVGAFSEEAVGAAVNLPENLRAVAMVPVGYPAEDEKPASPPERVEPSRAVEEIG